MTTHGMTDWRQWSREAVTSMQARNEAWITRFNLQRAPYHWDLTTAELVFDRATDSVVADICVVGTVSTAQGTFRWAWANEAISPRARHGLELVRAFGEAHDLIQLITPEWPAGRPDGLEMLAVAGRIQDADGAFVDDTGDISLFFTLTGFRLRPHTGGARHVAD